MTTAPTGGNPVPTSYYPPGVTPQIHNDLSVEENPGQLLTLSQTLKLNGEEYTVRLYIKKIPGKTYDQIKADPQVIQRMQNTIIKMVNLAVLFNVGKDKGEKGVVTGVSLSNKDTNVVQHLTKGSGKEKILADSLQRKFTSLSTKKNEITSSQLADDSNVKLLNLTQRLNALNYISNLPPVTDSSDDVDGSDSQLDINDLLSDEETEDDTEGTGADKVGKKGNNGTSGPNLRRQANPMLSVEEVIEDEKDTKK